MRSDPRLALVSMLAMVPFGAGASQLFVFAERVRSRPVRLPKKNRAPRSVERAAWPCFGPNPTHEALSVTRITANRRGRRRKLDCQQVPGRCRMNRKERRRFALKRLWSERAARSAPPPSDGRRGSPRSDRRDAAEPDSGQAAAAGLRDSRAGEGPGPRLVQQRRKRRVEHLMAESSACALSTSGLWLPA